MTLLQVVKLPGDPKGIPLFVEIPVHDESAPYLVTSNKGPLWIDESFKGVVRSAMLKANWRDTSAATFAAVVKAIQTRGRELSWGNTFPNTRQGKIAAEGYLRSYGLEPLETITRDEQNPWVPEGCAVMVPKDRSYLGMVGVLDDTAHTVVVHNPSRGMAVLGTW